MERCRPRRPPRSARSAIHRHIPNRNLKAISLSLCAFRMGVSSLMNDIELACLLLPRGKG